MASAKVVTMQSASGTLLGLSGAQNKLVERKMRVALRSSGEVCRKSSFTPALPAKKIMGNTQRAQRERVPRAALAERLVDSIPFLLCNTYDGDVDV